METPTSTTPAWPWALSALISAAAGTLALSAAASTVAEAWPPLPAAIAVAAGSAVLALALPLGVARWTVGRLRARGVGVKTARITAGLVVAFNVVWIVLVQSVGPAPLVRLLPERGTWLADALTGRGPFGPAAIPVATRLADAARTERSPDALADQLCDRTARALSTGILDELRGEGEDPPGVARLRARYGAAPAEAGAEPGPLPEGIDGRAFLVDTLDLVAGTLPSADLAELPAVDLAPGAAERTRIPFATEGYESRYEDGAWRTCLGTDADATERGRTWVRQDRALYRASQPVSLPPAWDAPVRDALRVAITGRTGFALGVPPADGWAEAFTGEAAAAQAGRVLAWCAPAAVDPARAPALQALRTKWALPDGPLDAASTAGLAGGGRELLAEVATACGPVAQDRVATELASGFPSTAEDRRRWTALDASTADRAVLTELSPGEIRAELAGAVVRVVDDRGTWRVDWR